MDDLRCFITDFPLESENDYFKLVKTENLLCCIVARTIFQRINESATFPPNNGPGFGFLKETRGYRSAKLRGNVISLSHL